MPSKAAAAAGAALVAALATACGDAGSEGGRQSLGAYLGTSAESCGMTENVSVRQVRRARTLEEQVAAVTRVVERIRELKLRRDVSERFLAPRQLRQQLQAEARQQLSRAEARTLSLALERLGAVPPGFDFYGTFVAAAVADVVGVYDPETQRILVAREGRGKLDSYELETLAHELEHALTDSVFDLPEPDARGWGDDHAALQALAEGSALATEFRVFAALQGDDELRLLLASPAGDTFSDQGLPHFLARSIAFPYLDGLRFVCALYEDGGWRAVDRAYRRFPASTAQILFPERYTARDRPARPPPLGRLRAPWRRASSLDGAFGAADLLFLFEAPGGFEDRALDVPREHAGAWDGGRIEVWRRGPAVAVALALAEHPDHDGLCASLRKWYEASFPRARRDNTAGLTVYRGSSQHAVVQCRGRAVRLGIAPSRSAARRLAAPRR